MRLKKQKKYINKKKTCRHCILMKLIKLFFLLFNICVNCSIRRITVMSSIYCYLNICGNCAINNKEYLALQNPEINLICAWKLSLNEGNYAITRSSSTVVKYIYSCKIQKKKSYLRLEFITLCINKNEHRS